MRILFFALEPPFPPNDGGRIRTYNLVRYLAAEHSVTLVAFESAKSPQDDWSPLSGICAAVHVLEKPVIGRPTFTERLGCLSQRRPLALRLYDSPTTSRLITQLVQSEHFDVFHVDQIYLAPYAKLLHGVPRVMNHVDVEAEKQQRTLLRSLGRFRPYWWLRWIEHMSWRSFEIESLAWFEAHCAVSERDARYFRARAKGVPVAVVPNGVDTGAFQPRPDPDNAPTILYVGSMDYPPNADAVLWFAERVLPLIRAQVPDVRFIVVGRNPPDEVSRLARLPNVEVTGTVPDVRPYYARAQLMVVPLRSGGGTRLKILEAMAMGVPVVSTALGCEGLDVEPGLHLLVVDAPEDFAAQTVRILGDDTTRAHLTQHAHDLVVERYDWSSVARQQLDVYRLAIQRHRASNGMTESEHR